MLLFARLLPVAWACQFAVCGLAAAQEEKEPQPDPAALKAFAEMVKAYRDRPALTVKSTVKIESAQGETTAAGPEIKGEFIFGPKRTAVIKLRGFTCYLNHDEQKPDSGTITAVHEATDHSYFTAPDDGSPYYALLNAFVDMPFPELAIELGEDSIEDVLLQFHPKAASGVIPSAVSTEQQDGKTVQRLKLTGPGETINILINPQTRLMQSLELRITGGDLVPEGTWLTYKHSYEYEIHDKPLDAATFKFDPGQRQRVDLMTTLLPRSRPLTPLEPGAGGGDGPGENAVAALKGKPAPPVVLATAQGKAFDLQDQRGRVVVLDFWASWCGPCMQGLPKLHEVAKWALQQELPVTFITINVWEIRDPEKDNPDARLVSAKATWEKRGFSLPIAMDYSDETAKAYHVSGIPTGVIIRSDGVVYAVHVGAGDDYVEEMKRDIQEALKAVEQ